VQTHAFGEPTACTLRIALSPTFHVNVSHGAVELGMAVLLKMRGAGTLVPASCVLVPMALKY
jgi:hypothetical protein